MPALLPPAVNAPATTMVGVKELAICVLRTRRHWKCSSFNMRGPTTKVSPNWKVFSSYLALMACSGKAESADAAPVCADR